MLLQARSRSSSPVRGSSSSAAGRSSSPQEKLVALPYKYYARAQQYEDVLGKSWDPLPGIRLFLDGHACAAALREAADAELQNAPAPVWAPGRKFYHVKDHKNRFPVLCEYLKTWSRRRGDQKSEHEQSAAAHDEITVRGGHDKEEATDVTSSSPSATATAVAVAPSASSEPSAPKKSVGASRDGETVHAADPARGATADPSPSPPPPQPFETEPPKDSVALPLDLTGKRTDDAPVVAYIKKMKTWYPGKIWHVNLDGSIDVHFDDGDRRNSMPVPLVRVDTSSRGQASLPDLDEDEDSVENQSPRGQARSKRAGSTSLVPGTLVRARHKLGWKYFSGKVTATDPICNTVDVLYDDGEAEAGLPRSAVKVLSIHRPSAAAGDMKKLGLAVRTRVEAKYGGKKKWFRGVLLKPVDGMQEGRYRVQYDTETSRIQSSESISGASSLAQRTGSESQASST